MELEFDTDAMRTEKIYSKKKTKTASSNEERKGEYYFMFFGHMGFCDFLYRIFKLV